MNNKCQRCGNELVNGQNFCNGCGMPINNQNMNNGYNVMNSSTGMGKLILSRQNKIWGCAMNLTVLINGYTYSLCNGQSYNLDLTPGVYNITWKFWSRRNKSIQINVMPGGFYCVDFKPDYLWGGFKLSDKCKFN